MVAGGSDKSDLRSKIIKVNLLSFNELTVLLRRGMNAATFSITLNEFSLGD
jgi:hypothetical protein